MMVDVSFSGGQPETLNELESEFRINQGLMQRTPNFAFTIYKTICMLGLIFSSLSAA